MGQSASSTANAPVASAASAATDAISAAAPLSGGARAATAAAGAKDKSDCQVCSDMAAAADSAAAASASAAAAATAAAAAPAVAAAATGAAAPSYTATGTGVEAPNVPVDSRVIRVWEHNNINERVSANPHNPQRALAYMHSGCPLNRREVGRAAWAYLHTVAAYYPDRPTAAQQQLMSQSMHAMGEFFPCGYCADKTMEHIAKHPPQTHSQQALAVWLCGVHNEVNERMGKPQFDCSPDALRVRWKTGFDGCRGK